MKVKKMLAGVVAGTLAFSTLASMSIINVNAEAKSTEFTLFEGTDPKDKNVFDSDFAKSFSIENLSNIYSGSFITGNASLTIQFEKLNAVVDESEDEEAPVTYTPSFQIAGNYQIDGSWPYPILFEYKNVEKDDGTQYEAGDIVNFKLDLDDTKIERFGNPCSADLPSYFDVIKNTISLTFKGKNAKILSIKLNCDYDAPTYDQWVDNEDGSYTYTHHTDKWGDVGDGDPGDKATFKLNDLITFDPTRSNRDIESISVDVKMGKYITAQLGASDAQLVYKSVDQGSSADGYTGTITLTPEQGLCDEAEILFKMSWMNNGESITISNPKVTYTAEPRPEVRPLLSKITKCARQYKSDKAYIRFIYTVDEKSVKKATSGEGTNIEVKFAALNPDTGRVGSYTTIATEKINCAYKSLIAAGSKIEAPEGKLFIISNQYTGHQNKERYQAVLKLDSCDGVMTNSATISGMPTTA